MSIHLGKIKKEKLTNNITPCTVILKALSFFCKLCALGKEVNNV